MNHDFSKLTQTPAQRQDKTKTRIMWAIGAILVLGLANSCQQKTPNTQALSPTQIAASYPLELDLQKDKRDAFAALINLNGELCADVKKVVITAPYFFEVECILYRSGEGLRTYMVNMKTGKAV